MNAVATFTLGELVRESGLLRLEAELLLAFLLGKNRAFLIAHADDPADADAAQAAGRLFGRRAAGEPIAYLTGEREFYGFALRVTPAVLIPRPETERLVELALERIPAGAPTRVLELGSGSGAIAIALAHERPGLRITATDVSEAALDVARDNARRHGVAIEFARGDWCEALGAARFELIVSNPPYVAASDPHLAQGDVRFEPRRALVGGEDGLDCIRRIAAQAREHLSPGGWLLFEHGYDQGAACVELLRRLGYAKVEDFKDLSAVPRVSVGRWPG